MIYFSQRSNCRLTLWLTCEVIGQWPGLTWKLVLCLWFTFNKVKYAKFPEADPGIFMGGRLYVDWGAPPRPIGRLWDLQGLPHAKEGAYEGRRSVSIFVPRNRMTWLGLSERLHLLESIAAYILCRLRGTLPRSALQISAQSQASPRNCENLSGCCAKTPSIGDGLALFCTVGFSEKRKWASGLRNLASLDVCLNLPYKIGSKALNWQGKQSRRF